MSAELFGMHGGINGKGESRLIHPVSPGSLFFTMVLPFPTAPFPDAQGVVSASIKPQPLASYTTQPRNRSMSPNALAVASSLEPPRPTLACQLG